jgi:hypothetical protein
MKNLFWLITILFTVGAASWAQSQSTSAASEGSAVIIGDVVAVAVDKGGTVTESVRIRDQPSTKDNLVGYRNMKPDETPLNSLPLGTSVRVIARTAEKVQVEQWNNYWYWIEFITPLSGKVQAYAYGEFIRLTAARAAQLEDVVVSAAGDRHSLAVKRDGTLWAWGSNDMGQLGVGTTGNHESPVQVGKEADWSSVAAGNTESFAIKQDGSLWAWGYNVTADDRIANDLTPRQVGTDKDWASVAAGSLLRLAVKRNGTLWAWGQNCSGQLGDGTTTDRRAPVRVGTTTDWSSVSAGQNSRSSWARLRSGLKYNCTTSLRRSVYGKVHSSQASPAVMVRRWRRVISSFAARSGTLTSG